MGSKKMDLAKFREVFEAMVKLNKTWDLRIQKETDSAMEAIQQALVELQSANNGEGDSPHHHQMSILGGLRIKVVDVSRKGLFRTITKITDLDLFNSSAYQVLIRYLKENISNTWRDVEWDTDIVNGIIASHLYREGLFDIGDCFVNEAHVLPDASAGFRSQSVGLHRMLDAMRSGDLGPALNWAESQHEQLLQKGSCLEMELNGQRCLEDAQKGRGEEMLAFAKAKLAPFAFSWEREFRMLVCCLLLYAGRVERSPYAGLMTTHRREKLANVLSQQYFDLTGQPARSPLRVVVAAGALALMDEELTDDLVFHSCCVCPILYDICTEVNPPMMLPCGHILCYMTIVNTLVSMSVESDGTVPHLTCGHSCPDSGVTTVDQCQQIYF